MKFAQELLNELRLEAAVTRRFLESVPFDKRDFKPHQKSESLGRLTIHVAEIVAWWKEVIDHDELDFVDFEPKEISSTSELLLYFDTLLADALQALSKTHDEDLIRNTWSMRHGEEILFTVPKKQALRIFCMNHLVHHRAQLGVYLRMIDVPVPASYGPSADSDDDVILITPYQSHLNLGQHTK
jgi:uncharacterized damage-inducible protein DinB